MKIAFDEWNLRGWHHPGFPRKKVLEPDDKEGADYVAKREISDIAAQYTMSDALFCACFFNACLRHCEDVGMSNIAPIVNTRGPLFVHPTGIVKRAHFHTIAMYANLLHHHVGTIDVTSSEYGSGKQAIPAIDSVATVDDTGKHWAVALVNRSPDHVARCTITLDTKPLEGSLDATFLVGDSTEAYNDVEHPTRVVPERKKLTFTKGTAELPAHSLTIVHFTAP